MMVYFAYVIYNLCIIIQTKFKIFYFDKIFVQIQLTHAEFDVANLHIDAV
jgi:hypothetical protein